jgi:ADP-ribose pyrophosphatase YjhB (NUDIX family)
MSNKNAYCGYCGTSFPENMAFPRTCVSCANITYLNPLPVAVLLLPIDNGLLTIRRALEPGQGELALPGGFINLGESWQAAAVRELEEETGIRIDADEVRDFRVLSAPDGTVLVFGLAHGRRAAELPPFSLSEETTEVTVVYGPTPLAFSLHTRVVAEYFGHRAQGALI